MNCNTLTRSDGIEPPLTPNCWQSGRYRLEKGACSGWCDLRCDMRSEQTKQHKADKKGPSMPDRLLEFYCKQLVQY